MGDKTVSVRVRFEGGDQVKAGLQEVGREGTRALQSIGTVSAATGAKLQNAGYQVSDFFVQVGAGTSPTRALAQQLPQLLQGFGLVGVAASVLIAALPGLWSLFSSGAEDAEALQKELDGISKAVDLASQSAELAREPIESLRQKYGDLAESIRDARVQEAELRRGQAVRGVNNLLGDLQSKTIPDNFSSQEIAAQAATRQQVLDRLTAAEVEYRAAVAAGDAAQMQALAAEEQALKAKLRTLGDIREVVSGVANDYGITTEQASGLAVMIERVRESAGQGAAQQIAAASALRDYLVEVFGSMDAANEATNGLAAALNLAVTENGNLAAIDIAGPIGAGSDEAARLAGNLSTALSNYSALAGRTGQGGADAARSALWGATYLDGQQLVTPVTGAGLSTPKVPGRGGAGGGGADQDIARAVALTESLRSETEKYAIALEEINRLKAKGLITDETYMRQLDKLNEKLGTTGDLGKKAASAIRSAFDGLFDDPAAALKDLAKQLAMMALYSQLGKSFPSIFGGGGLIPLGVPGFAAGGRHRGGLRIVGENGPELEATGPSMIYPADALRRMGRGGGDTTVNVTNMSGGEVETQERRGPNGGRTVDIIIGKSLTSGRQDSALRSRFGSRPNPVKR